MPDSRTDASANAEESARRARVAKLRTRLEVAGGIILFGILILSTRLYLVDEPILHLLGFDKGPDPVTLHLRGEFVESNLGVSEEPAGTLTVRMIAQQYVFVPQCITIPAGKPVRFRITSADSVHMLSFAGTNYSLKAVPGVVTEANLTFPKPGVFQVPCREFCGPGHFAMRSHLKVVPDDEFSRLNSSERQACEAH